MCCLSIHTVSPGNGTSVTLKKQAILITDAPTMFMPGLLSIAELGHVSGFELRMNQRILGVASLNSIPIATFTAEGGFVAPPDYRWTPVADEELLERLARLGHNPG
jgi:hypothetical protein